MIPLEVQVAAGHPVEAVGPAFAGAVALVVSVLVVPLALVPLVVLQGVVHEARAAALVPVAG